MRLGFVWKLGSKFPPSSHRPRCLPPSNLRCRSWLQNNKRTRKIWKSVLVMLDYVTNLREWQTTPTHHQRWSLFVPRQPWTNQPWLSNSSVVSNSCCFTWGLSGQGLPHGAPQITGTLFFVEKPLLILDTITMPQKMEMVLNKLFPKKHGMNLENTRHQMIYLYFHDEIRVLVTWNTMWVAAHVRRTPLNSAEIALLPWSAGWWRSLATCPIRDIKGIKWLLWRVWRETGKHAFWPPKSTWNP